MLLWTYLENRYTFQKSTNADCFNTGPKNPRLRKSNIWKAGGKPSLHYGPKRSREIVTDEVAQVITDRMADHFKEGKVDEGAPKKIIRFFVSGALPQITKSGAIQKNITEPQKKYPRVTHNGNSSAHFQKKIYTQAFFTCWVFFVMWTTIFLYPKITPILFKIGKTACLGYSGPKEGQISAPAASGFFLHIPWRGWLHYRAPYDGTVWGYCSVIWIFMQRFNILNRIADHWLRGGMLTICTMLQRFAYQ